jgi:hypothetical protein
MLVFLAENIATIIVGAVVLAVAASIVAKLVRDKRNKKSSCGCGSCSGCPSAGSCDMKKT